MKNSHDDEVSRAEYLLQKMMGMDDASLLKEAAEAERQWEMEKKLHPEEADQIMKNAETDLELLMARLDAEGKKPVTRKQFERNRRRDRREGREYKKYKRLILAVVVGVLVVGSMSSVAKSGYRYTTNPKQGKGSALLRYNSNIESVNDELDVAYDYISKSLDIPVLKMDYIPKEMIFIEAEVEKGHAVIRFDYLGKSVYLKEDRFSEKRAISILESDRKAEIRTYNDWIEKEIFIEENKLKNGDIEYSTSIEDQDAFYYISGVMKREEFIKIVENLSYY
ncbi:DUF4367 domain-containing protein [bacterium D16-54]|nr:DUF4367 domain-containing protein [bacterium D16-54]RKJ14265.1 DUF4367 domain-containing protein [bacterium D16-56]